MEDAEPIRRGTIGLCPKLSLDRLRFLRKALLLPPEEAAFKRSCVEVLRTGMVSGMVECVLPLRCDDEKEAFFLRVLTVSIKLDRLVDVEDGLRPGALKSDELNPSLERLRCGFLSGVEHSSIPSMLILLKLVFKLSPLALLSFLAPPLLDPLEDEPNDDSKEAREGPAEGL